MSFSVEEIGTMLDEYIQNKEVVLDKAYFSERFYFYTSGYPFLVSKQILKTSVNLQCSTNKYFMILLSKVV
jgi:hypothetical protein